MGKPLVEVEHLKVYFRSHQGSGMIKALDDVDLAVSQGEMFSVVGESGSGKTTLGLVIAGLARPTRDSVVRIDGERTDYRKRSQRHLWRKVQMVFQDPYSSFNPLATVVDSLTVPIVKYGIAKGSEVRATLEACLSDVGLRYDEIVGKYPGELSGGQRQRASIARAIVVNPRLLIADEPISMLDVSLRVEILGLLKRLNESRALTTLFITHDLGAAQYLGGRVAVLYKGQVMEIGGPRIFSSPRNPYTELLLDAMPSLSGKGWLSGQDVRQREVDPHRFVGCSFYPRCPRAGQTCAAAKPPMAETGEDGHLVACYFPSPGTGKPQIGRPGLPAAERVPEVG